MRSFGGEVAQLNQLVVAEERHPLGNGTSMRRRDPAERRGTGVGRADERTASVLGIRALRDESARGHPVDEARDARLTDEHVRGDVAQARGHVVAARDREQHVVLGLGQRLVEVAADLLEHLVLRPEEALPGVDGEAAIGHTHKSTANAGAIG